MGQYEIIDFLKKNREYHTSKQIILGIGKSHASVSVCLRKLIDQGVVEVKYIKRPRNFMYKIKNNGLNW